MTSPSTILRVGKEPTVVWEEDETSGLPRFMVIMPGWRIRMADGGIVTFGPGASVSATVVKVEDEPLVPSDPRPNIEDGFVLLGGYTLNELRGIARQRPEGWVSLRARLAAAWTFRRRARRVTA